MKEKAVSTGSICVIDTHKVLKHFHKEVFWLVQIVKKNVSEFFTNKKEQSRSEMVVFTRFRFKKKKWGNRENAHSRMICAAFRPSEGPILA